MDNAPTLDFVVRTPHDDSWRTSALSVRVLCESGHVGLRPRMEPTVLAVEVGIVNVQTNSGTERFVGTAGGLLTCDGSTATLLTPLAVAGKNEQQIAERLDAALQQPNSELEARAALSKLEGHILSELRREQTDKVTRRFGQIVQT